METAKSMTFLACVRTMTDTELLTLQPRQRLLPSATGCLVLHLPQVTMLNSWPFNPDNACFLLPLAALSFTFPRSQCWTLDPSTQTTPASFCHWLPCPSPYPGHNAELLTLQPRQRLLPSATGCLVLHLPQVTMLNSWPFNPDNACFLLPLAALSFTFPRSQPEHGRRAEKKSRLVPALWRSPPHWPGGKASASRGEDPGFEFRLSRDFFAIESYQWLQNWHSSGYPARRLAL